MTQTADVVVAGGGHNSLITAAYLTKAGYECLVLEARAIPGGGAATEDGEVKIFETAGQPVFEFKAPHSDTVLGVCFSPDSTSSRTRPSSMRRTMSSASPGNVSAGRRVKDPMAPEHASA